MEQMENKKPKFLKDLFDRRFPQIIFIYLGICWTILEFVSWIVEHYKISPYLTDLSFITLMSMVPTVGMLAYFHGRPGRDEYTKTEKIGIPVNVIITCCLIFYFLGGKELGSATTEISVVDEAGQHIQREVPKRLLMKRLAIFFFENESDDPDQDWLQYALMAGCHYDLNQDPIFSVYSGYDDVIYQKISSAGFSDQLGMPMALEQKIAREIEREYFLGGSFKTAGDTLIVSTYLYRTINGQLIAENTFRGTDIFHLMDEINRRLKEDLQVPAWHIAKTTDLPVAETITKSIDAFRQYILGLTQMNLNNDLNTARKYFEAAVSADPTFALAYYSLYQLYINLNLYDKALQSLNVAMQYLYKFPESVQFAVKEEYYLISEDPEKRTAVIDMWVQLYPDDIRGHFRLANEYLRQFKIDEAINEYNKILAIDPERKYYHRYIGDAYLIKGDFNNAVEYYKQYQRAFPKDYRSFMAFGNLFLVMGKYEKAKSYFTDAQLMEPRDITLMTLLAIVDQRTGDFTEALKKLNQAEIAAATPVEKHLVYSVISDCYRERGEIRKALEYSLKMTGASEEYQKTIDVVTGQIDNNYFGLYAMLGQKKTALEQLDTYRKTLAKPWLRLLSLGYLQVALETKDSLLIGKYIKEAEEALRIFGENNRLYVIHNARGKLFELNKDYLSAIMEYQKEVRYLPVDVTVLCRIGRCYRKMGDYSKAKRFLEKTLDILPMHAPAHLELTRIFVQTGDYEKARQHMEIVNSVWKNADPEFAPAREAQQFFTRYLQPAI